MRYIFSACFLLLLFSCETAPQQADTNAASSSTINKKIAGKITDSLRNGDIIFQSSKSGQSLAIQIATHSQYSHCGLIFWVDGKCMVYEAVQPIMLTPLQEFIDRGDNDHYVVKRLKDTSKLSDNGGEKLLKICKAYDGKNYDLYFDWSDEKIYCSELVWKSYHKGIGVELAQPMKLKDFDLSNPIVKKKLNERYGNKIPLNEPVISPSQLYDSEVLEEVYREGKL